MKERKIFRYAPIAEPFVIETPKKQVEVVEEPVEEEIPEGPTEEELAAERIKQMEAEANKLLEDAFQKSQDADERLKEADFEAKRLIQETQNECEQIIAETQKNSYANAKQEFERAKKQGHSEGFKAGHDEGLKAGHDEGVKIGRDEGEKAVREEMADLIKQANAKAEKTLQDAKEQTADYFIRAEDDVVKVVMMAIEKILPQHFLDVPQVVLPLVRETIKYVRDQKEIKIHVEPESYDLVLMARAELQSMLTDNTATLEVVSDDTLKPGDCVIETPNGGVDAKLSTQIERMTDKIKTVLNK